MKMRSRLATLTITAAVAVGAFSVGQLMHQRNARIASVSLTASTLPNTKQTISQQMTATVQTKSNVTYLHIKEWHVKLPLPTGLEDAYYVPGVSSVSLDGTPNQIYLGLKSLDAYGCTAAGSNHGQDSAIALIFRALPTDTDPVSGKFLTQQYPGGATIIGYYYGYVDLVHTTCKASSATLQTINSGLASAAQNTTTDLTN